MQRLEQLLYCSSCSQTRRTIQWRRPRWESRLVCSRTAGAAAASFVLQAHAQGRAQAPPEVPARDNRRRGREQQGEGLGVGGGKWGGGGARDKGRRTQWMGRRTCRRSGRRSSRSSPGQWWAPPADYARPPADYASAIASAGVCTVANAQQPRSHQPERISHGIERHRRRVTGGTRGRGSGWTFFHTITIQCDRSSPWRSPAKDVKRMDDTWPGERAGVAAAGPFSTRSPFNVTAAGPAATSQGARTSRAWTTRGRGHA